MPSRRIVLLAILALHGSSSLAQRRPLVVGVLLPWEEGTAEYLRGELSSELRALGYAPESNLTLALEAARGDYSRLPSLAEKLVNRKVDLIVASGASAVTAARQASATMPLVFFNVADPIALGVAESFARPGRNATGITTVAGPDLPAKRIELLLLLVPHLSRVAFLVNPASSPTEIEAEIRSLAETFGMQGLIVRARSVPDLEPAFMSMATFAAQAVIVQVDSFFASVPSRIAELAFRYRIASVFGYSGAVEVGGLMSYGADTRQDLRRVVSCVDKILRGERAGDIPIQQPTTYQFVLNRKIAEALGYNLSKAVILAADRVVE